MFDSYLERIPEVVDGDEALLVAVERREALHVLADLALAQSDRDGLLRCPAVRDNGSFNSSQTISSFIPERDALSKIQSWVWGMGPHCAEPQEP